MPVPTSITDLDTNEALNSPAGSDAVGGTLDDYLRSQAAIIKRQFAKGSTLSSASNLLVPADGSYMNVNNVVSTISTFADNFNGRTVALKFAAGITLAHSASLILPGGANIVTKADDVAVFVNESAGVWRCLSYPNAPTYNFTSKLIGEVFSVRTDLVGHVLPPTNSPEFRYIVLTASDAYNSGVLINESVTGSAPNVVATAEIDYPSSPFHGQTVNLINTERRTLRAGDSGTLQDGQNESHTHDVTAASSGSHSHTGTTNQEGHHQHRQSFTTISNRDSGVLDWYSPNGATSLSTATTGPAGAHSHTVSTNLNGSHTHDMTVSDEGGDEVRVRNQGITYLMRIA